MGGGDILSAVGGEKKSARVGSTNLKGLEHNQPMLHFR